MDSGPALYLVQGRAKPVVHGPNNTECRSILEKPHAGLDECPRILPLCFRARNSARAARIINIRPKVGSKSDFLHLKSCHRLRSLGYRAYPTLYFGPEKSHKINRFDSIIQFGLSSFALLSEIMSWIMTIDQLCTSYHICQSYQGYQYFLNSYPKHY